MSFHILVNGTVSEYNFKYQDKSISSAVNKVMATELMTKKIEFLNGENTVQDARIFMQRYNIHHIPIVFENKIKGLITSSDLIGKEEEEYLKDHMSNTILAGSENTSLDQVIQVFLHEDIHSLPIINNHYKVIGLLTQSDILKWVLSSKAYIK